jgi:hypothetical protein
MSIPPSVTPTVTRVGLCAAIGVLAIAVAASGSARAQSASGTLSSYRTGYGGSGLSGLDSPVSPSLINTSSQFAVSDGVNQAGSVGSVFTTQTSSVPTSSSQTSGGAGQSYTGVGQAAVSNERAPLAVVEKTTANTAGAHSATTSATAQTSPATPLAGAPTTEAAPSDLILNGKLNLDGGQ